MTSLQAHQCSVGKNLCLANWKPCLFEAHFLETKFNLLGMPCSGAKTLYLAIPGLLWWFKVKNTFDGADVADRDNTDLSTRPVVFSTVAILQKYSPLVHRLFWTKKVKPFFCCSKLFVFYLMEHFTCVSYPLLTCMLTPPLKHSFYVLTGQGHADSRPLYITTCTCVCTAYADAEKASIKS